MDTPRPAEPLAVTWSQNTPPGGILSPVKLSRNDRPPGAPGRPLCVRVNLISPFRRGVDNRWNFSHVAHLWPQSAVSTGPHGGTLGHPGIPVIGPTRPFPSRPVPSRLVPARPGPARLEICRSSVTGRADGRPRSASNKAPGSHGWALSVFMGDRGPPMVSKTPHSPPPPSSGHHIRWRANCSHRPDGCPRGHRSIPSRQMGD